MSDGHFNVDTSGKGADAKHSGWARGSFIKPEARGGDGIAGNIKIGANRTVNGGTFKSSGQGGTATGNPGGSARGGDGKGGNFVLE